MKRISLTFENRGIAIRFHDKLYFDLEIKVERLGMEDCWAFLETFNDYNIAYKKLSLLKMERPENTYRLIQRDFF